MANGHRGRRMAKEWINSLTAGNSFTADATAILGSVSFNVPGTVLRMIGEYIIAPTAAPVAGDEAVISIGIGFVSGDAFTLGSTAMPDPGAEPQFPWLFWSSHVLRYTTTALPADLGVGTLRRQFDIKSMRKFKPRETLVMVAEYADSAGAPPIRISCAPYRVLVAT